MIARLVLVLAAATLAVCLTVVTVTTACDALSHALNTVTEVNQ